MKKLENEVNLQEMSVLEMKSVDGGGPWGWVWDWLKGEAISHIPEAAAAYAQVIQEGGTTCDMMPFK